MNATFTLKHGARILLAGALAATAYLATSSVSGTAVADVNDKVQHVAAFAVMGALADWAFPGPPARYWRVHLPWLLGYGLLIESVQYFLPHRSADVMDLIADAAGLVLYGLVSSLLPATLSARRG